MSTSLQDCCVCQRALGMRPYRCPKCKAPYCGASCFKEHREICDAITEVIDSAEIAPEMTYDTAIHRLEQSPASTSKRPRNDEDDPDALVVLQKHHLAALASDHSVRDALKTAELQKLIRIIDGSRSRLDALDAALHNISEFRQFCNTVLGIVSSVHVQHQGN